MSIHWFKNSTDAKKFPNGLLPPLLNRVFSWNRIFVFSGGQTCVKKEDLLVIWQNEKEKLIVHWWAFKQNWHALFLIIQSKLNLLTEPENKDKQGAWIILLLSVNSTFLVREIFKRSWILHVKQRMLTWRFQITTFHVIMQIQANFTTSTTFQVKVFAWSPFCFRETFLQIKSPASKF